MPKVFRIAIGGTGHIAGVHAAALRGLPGADLAGAADIDRARLAAFGGGLVRPADLGQASPSYGRMDGPGAGWEQW